MKTSFIKNAARVAGFAVALALLTLTASEVTAQEKGSAKGGARLLLPPSPSPAPSDYKPMSCAKCKDEWVERPVVAMKATAPKTQLIARHLCGGCDTTIAVEGFGKAKHDVVTHKCSSCGAAEAACCATKKTS
jgi:hypothetical protein